MSASVFRRDNCRLCGSQDIELVLELAPTPVGDAYVSEQRLEEVQETYPVDLFLCKNCGLAQLPDVIDPEILYRDFIYVTSISLGLVEHFQGYVEDVLHRIKPPAGSLVIDIGSNDGTVLRFFQQQGMRVLGVEPALEIARKATESGIETLPTFFNAELGKELKRDRGGAAIVTSNNTFANIDDLADMTAGIRELLTADGVFVFETGYLLDLVKNEVFDNIYHEHLNYFCVKPLEAFFRKMGMELIDIDRVETKGGSLRGTVQLAGGDRSVSPSVNKFIAAETEFGIDRPEIFQDLATKLYNVKNQLLSLLGDLKAQGKTIAGYGASVGVTTLSYYFELDPLLSFIVDDNPAKHNLFSPGHHIPVFASEIIYERRPDYLVILAWRYAEPIMKKHQAYLAQGGHFIILWPEIEIK